MTCGLVAAFQRYLARDHKADLRTWELCVERWVKGLEGIPGVVASRSFPNEAGRPVPRLEVQIDLDRYGFGARELERRLWDGEPRVAVLRDQDQAVCLTPDTLDDPAEEDLVLEVLLRALGRR
jgi:L-seryl-tRNA(Ser) seleniumtransferase